MHRPQKDLHPEMTRRKQYYLKNTLQTQDLVLADSWLMQPGLIKAQGKCSSMASFQRVIMRLKTGSQPEEER